MTNLRRYSKLVTALIGAVGVAISEGLLPSSSAQYVSIIVSVFTAFGVYTVPNSTG